MKAVLCALLLLVAQAGVAGPAAAQFAPTLAVPGATLRLNGAGARLYSVFKVRVYVAALYLEQPSQDAAEILASPQRKAIEVRALRAVSAEDVQAAWRAAFEANCRPPCRVPSDADTFVGGVGAVREGGRETYLFEPAGVRRAVDGVPAGTFGPDFAQLLLSTFIGASPPTEALKNALLGRTP